MTLEEALAYIHKVDWRGSVPGLSRIDTLLGLLGHPERSVKYVHVTGTNGKGSTCAMLASVLRAAGYKTGLYTSPYIFRFNERMQIGGVPIPDRDVCALVEEIRLLADSMDDHPTEFELVTAMGLTWFARQRCDIVVCEVGMGGEFDATNVIPAPEAAVITNIGLDHTAVLGGTVEQIAATKAGIIKRGCSAVLYPCAPSVQAVIESRCRAVGAPLTVADFDALSPVSDTLEGQVFDCGAHKSLRLPLLGGHQLKNAAVALTAIDALRQRGWRIPESAVVQGLAAVTWPGRFQVVRRTPTVSSSVLTVKVTVFSSAPCTSTVKAVAPWPITAPSATGSSTFSVTAGVSVWSSVLGSSFCPQAASARVMTSTSSRASSFFMVFFICTVTPYHKFL